MSSPPDDAARFRATPLAAFLHDLGSAHCWEVLELLAHRSCPVTSIAQALELEVSDISRCLSKLSEMGLLDCRQSGKCRIYGLSDAARYERNCERAALILRCDGTLRISIDVTLR